MNIENFEPRSYHSALSYVQAAKRQVKSWPACRAFTFTVAVEVVIGKRVDTLFGHHRVQIVRDGMPVVKGRASHGRTCADGEIVNSYWVLKCANQPQHVEKHPSMTILCKISSKS